MLIYFILYHSAFFILEKGISLLGYHLCNYSVIKNVSKTVAYQKSYEKQTPCGWIPWRLCTTTYYKEEYHPIMVQEAVNVTDCCAGYEQVGLYCSLPINRSNEFASRPGACPMKIGEALKSSCVSDMDCPEYKKCCKTSTGVYCSDPVPEVTKYWYNVSVLVKTDFSELYKVDPRLLNHSRLLHSMITGALWPMDISVYHIQTTKSETYAETLVSHVLVGLQQLVPLVNISSLLKKIVIRVYEVIDVIAIEGMASHNPNGGIQNHKIFGVTSSSFKASWSINSSQNHSFRAEVYKSNELVERMETTDMNLTMLNLEAGVMYTMNISYEACGKNITSSRIVKTDALIFGLTLRILNYNFTNQFLNVSSREYQNFSRTLMGKVMNSYPSNMNALHLSGKLKVQVDSIKAGSIIVKLKIIIQDLNFSKDLSAFDPMIASLYNSSMLGIDPKISAVEDWDECAHRTENDCSMSAECINTVGSYRCRCKTATDANPARPGRNCEGKKIGLYFDGGFVYSHELRKCLIPVRFHVLTHHLHNSVPNRPLFHFVFSAPFPAERIFFSNVTNTSFQISWITHFPANTTFHFLLFVEEQLIKETKTQSSHLNISDLKAGTLYTVKIKPDLYGNESKTMQRKVKTAAQKFNGVVRIMNLNYSSEFSNSRSEKHQNFSKMFLNEVRTYLPPNILQKMDAGMINISIVSIIPGSIVVNFSLLIPIDMDGRNVAGYLLEAFRNSSLFEVDNNNNECEREETDCSPNATCYNIYGSYECKCKEGFVNVNAERPGRNCEGKNATVNTTNNKKNISQTTNINYLPQNLPSINSSAAGSVKEAVQVLCEFEKIVISIKKDFLYQQSIPETSLYLGHPRCNVSSSNSSHVVLETDWNECETEIQTNITHTVARTILRDDYSSHGIIHDIKISSQIHCIFQNDLLISSGHTSEGVYTIFEDLHGSGHFLTEMRLLIGNSPIPPNFSISGSDNVIIEVGVQTRSKKLKVVVSQCWATPTNNSTDPPFFFSCPVPNRNTTVIVNGVANRARFKLNIFSFFNGSMVYLHCKVQICIATPKSTCRANCQGFRFWKSGEIIATPKTTWGPLRKFNGKSRLQYEVTR
uniref:Uromodulin like 1 n=1 Tax=Pseudonaja textilis TaxID=8673 RepID=A0A670YTT2_PSETE